MKTFTRWLLMLLLVAIPMMAVINTASANTELAPASRLVAPYITNTATRSTFILLTNVSAVDLRGNSVAPAASAVHAEFYNSTCNRTDRPLRLSPNDIDQVNVVATDFAGGDTRGFVDLDVRASEASTAASQRANVLMGHVIITDSASDFALSYPMAAGLGSSQGNVSLSTIVTRNIASGRAAVWTGRYEAFANHLYVPGFYAEGGSGSGSISESLMAIASPADGNWYGASAAGVNYGEAPGQDLALPAGSVLISMPLTNIYDGCEVVESRPLSGHYVNGALTTLYDSTLSRTGPPPWSVALCGLGFGGLDELSGSPVGWITLPNISCARAATDTAGSIATGACTATGGGFVNGASTGGPGTGLPTAALGKLRGITGVLFEVTVVASSSTRGADVARLWSNPLSITGQTGCRDSAFANAFAAAGDAATANVIGCPFSLNNMAFFP